MSASTLINGEPAEKISVHDRGFQYGDGLFETIAVARGTPLLWQRHMERLQRDAARLGLPAPDAAQLREEAASLCAHAGRAVLKIIVTRGVSGRGYAPPENPQAARILSVSSWPEYPLDAAEQGVAVRFCRTRLGTNPQLAGVKHLNRVEQVLARAEWRDRHAEGLMQTTTGDVVEGTMSNLFIVSDGTLFTPDLAHCGVAGVMRGLVLEQTQNAMPVHIAALSREQVLDADELFLTNSLIGVWPVRELEDRDYAVGPVTRRMQQLVREAEALA